MNRPGQFIRQNFVDHAVTLNQRLALESLRHHFHPEMAFAIWPRTRMTCMQMRFVDHLQRRRLKSRRQLVTDFLSDWTQSHLNTL